MTKKRVSNEQLLSSIGELTAAISALVAAQATPQVQQPATIKEEPTPTVVRTKQDDQPYNVSASYMANRKEAAQEHANKVGGPVVLYARQNLAGRIVLAYAQAGRYANLRDKGFLGKVAEYHPNS